MLRLDAGAADQIRREGAAGYPNEICGLLTGRIDGEIRMALQAWPMTNSWDKAEARAGIVRPDQNPPGGEPGADAWGAHGRERRFVIEPSEMMQAMMRARKEGLEIVGVYHSHPDHPAAPSVFDRDAAWPEWSYLILSVADGRPDQMRSWVCSGDGPFLEEELEAMQV